MDTATATVTAAAVPTVEAVEEEDMAEAEVIRCHL